MSTCSSRKVHEHTRARAHTPTPTPRFEMLLEMPGHQGEVWALAASAYGDFVVSGSHDRSIRK